MNLGRIRAQLTALFGLLAALAIAAIAIVAIRLGTERIESQTERWSEERMARAIIAVTWDEAAADIPNDFWIVDTTNDWIDVPGETHLEPPLGRITDVASPDGWGFTTFEQDDATWLAYARRVNDDQVFVVADYMEGAEKEISSLRLRIVLGGLGALASTVGISYWLAGRLLRPARIAMDQQRDFIADAAHELRTPLAVIQASASHSLSRERTGDDYRESLHEIREAAERAGAGVGELLELARIQAGQAEPRRAPLRLDLLVEEVGGTTRVEGVTVTGRPGDPLVVDADYNLLRQAVTNVAQNAAARAANVMIKSYRDEKWATVEITDDGPGFDPEVLPHVFERFRSGDERGSLGLGMSIVRTILAAHDGRCEASNIPGGGASVKLLLPASD